MELAHATGAVAMRTRGVGTPAKPAAFLGANEHIALAFARRAGRKPLVAVGGEQSGFADLDCIRAGVRCCK